MIETIVCHAAADREMARHLEEFLEAGTPARVRKGEGEIGEGGTLLDKVEEWTAGTAVVVVLSDASVPGPMPREKFQRVLIDEPNESGAPVLFLLRSPCPYPALLRRQAFFDATPDARAAFRGIKRRLLEIAGGAREPEQERPAGFAADEDLLETLWCRLADAPGAAVLGGEGGAGKTALALEFAHRAGGEFEAVVWLECEHRDLTGLAGDCAAQLGIPCDGEPALVLERIRGALSARRCLLVLDGLTSDGAAQIWPGRRCSALVTTREPGLWEGAASLEAERLGTPGAPAGSRAEEAELAAAIGACAPGGCSLDVAAAIAELGRDRAEALAAAMISRGALWPVGRTRGRVQLPSPLRTLCAAASPEQHARGVRRRFDSNDVLAQFDLEEARRAFRWASKQHGTWRLACEVWRRGVAAALRWKRAAEALRLAGEMEDAAGARGDEGMEREARRERAWILEGWDRLEEARAADPLFWPKAPQQLELFSAAEPPPPLPPE